MIWKLCDGMAVPRRMVIDLLKGEYPDAESPVETDVREAVELLVREGALLEVSPHGLIAGELALDPRGVLVGGFDSV